MTAHQLRHFSRPEVLKSLADDSFLALLRPHVAFFVARGIELPAPGERFKPDYDVLSRLFLAPESGMPDELIEALFFVDGMATPDGMDMLLAAIPQIDPPWDHWTPYDVAVQGWLLDREAFERVFAERQVRKRSRSFISFRADHRLPALSGVTDMLPALERELDGHFQARGRGRGTQVLSADKEDGVWFLIRHGEPLKREGCMQDGESSSIFFRPEKFDAVVYDANRSELRINATSRWQKELYRRLFGQHLFGSEDCFPSDDKYTLQPLLSDGEAALSCLDVIGIRFIRLVALAWCRHGKHGVETIKKAPDLFAAARDGECDIPLDVRPIWAQFEVCFAGSRSSRLVSVSPPNVARYTLDSDGACVEEWLARRGFVITNWNDNYGGTDAEPVLASA